MLSSRALLLGRNIVLDLLRALSALAILHAILQAAGCASLEPYTVGRSDRLNGAPSVSRRWA